MPKLPQPTARSSGAITAGSPGVARLPNPTPDAYGAGVGQGLTGVGQALFALDGHFQDQRNKLELVDMETRMEAKFQEARQRIEREPDVSKFDSLIEDARINIYHDIVDEASNGNVRTAFKAYADRYIQQQRVELNTYGRKMLAERQIVESIKAAKSKMVDAALYDEKDKVSGILRSTGEDLINSLVANGHLDPIKGDQELQKVQDVYWSEYAINHPAEMLAIQREGGREHGMDRTKLDHYSNISRAVLNGRAAEAERLRKEQERQLHQEQKQTQDAFVGKMTEGTLTSGEIMRSNLEPVGQGSKEHFIHLLEAKVKADSNEARFVKDPETFASTLRKIRKGQITTEEEVEQVFFDSVKRDRGITWEDTVKLRAEVDDVRTPEGSRLGKKKASFLEGVKAQIDKSNPLMGNIDHEGRQKFYEFGQYVDEKVNEQRQAGKDPHALFDPKSPDYLGAAGMLAPFQKTIQESLRDISEKMKQRKPATPEVTPRLEGETPQQYLDRTKKK